MKSVIILILLVPFHVSTDYCDSDKCYQSVSNDHQKLRELLNKGYQTIRKTQFPQFEDVFDGILKRLENNEQVFDDDYVLLENNLKTLKDSFRNLPNYNKLLDRIKQELPRNPDYDDLNRILTAINQRLEYFENLLTTNENVTKTCNKTEQNYKQFKTITDDLSRDYERIEKESQAILDRIIEINGNIEGTTKETEKNYKSFQQIQIPFSFERSLIDNLDKKINQSLANLQNNHHILEELLKKLYNNRSEIIQLKLQKVGDGLTELQSTLDIIWQILNEYGDDIPKFDDNKPLITEDSIKLIDRIDNLTLLLDNRLKQLEDELSTITLKFEDDKNKLNTIINNLTTKLQEEQQLLNDYKRFLSILLNIGTNQGKIQVEIDKVRKTIDLINQKEQIKLELDDIKRIYDELVKYGTDGICAVDVRFEE